MIVGVVNADREALLHLSVNGPQGQQHRIEALVDTGFNGWLSLPPSDIAALRLPWLRRNRAFLADGSKSTFDVYEATVLWDKRRRRIAVDEADCEPCIGMALLTGFELNVQVRTGGKVTVKRLA